MMGYAAVGLFNPKNRINIGAVLRAAGCFGAAFVSVQGARYRRAPTDTHKAWRHMPLFHTDDLLPTPYDCVPVAVELRDGATPLPSYEHPQRAMYIFGPEDGSLPDRVLSRCRDIVVVPSGCLNLAACVNVVLYDRVAKQ